jgi:hypothetical protein
MEIPRNKSSLYSRLIHTDHLRCLPRFDPGQNRVGPPRVVVLRHWPSRGRRFLAQTTLRQVVKTKTWDHGSRRSYIYTHTRIYSTDHPPCLPRIIHLVSYGSSSLSPTDHPICLHGSFSLSPRFIYFVSTAHSVCLHGSFTLSPRLIQFVSTAHSPCLHGSFSLSPPLI